MRKIGLACCLSGLLFTGSIMPAVALAAPVAAMSSQAGATSVADNTAAVTTTAETVTTDTTVMASPQAAAAPTDTTAPATEPPALDKGDTAWLLVSTALVLMMTIPGLALFYAGMVRRKNVLSMMTYSLSAAALVSVLWVIIGYSLAFGTSEGMLAPFIGGFDKAMLSGVGVSTVWTDAAGTAYTIPESLFMVFQMTFAIITVAIMSGAIAERMKFSAYLLFIGLWVLAVYAPIAHWVWNAEGWLFGDGALDYAGGTVVHINSGIAGLVAAYVLGRRIGIGREPMAPHNLVLTLIGAGMLWVGWFGFNAGSALAADGRAAMAMVVTQVAAATAAFTWMMVERMVRGKSSALGAASGAIAGLVAITPAAGFVTVGSALIIGVIAGAVCFWGVTGLKRLLKADDSLDAFGLHGVGGIVGAILTGFLATEFITGTETKPVMEQLWVQVEGVLATLVYSGIMTFILLKLVDMTIGLRVTDDAEREGLDVSQHGERVE